MISANVVPITASKINEYFIVCVFLVPICNEIRVGYQILIRHYNLPMMFAESMVDFLVELVRLTLGMEILILQPYFIMLSELNIG